MKNLIVTILLVCGVASFATAQDVYSSSGKALNKQKTNVKSDKLIDPDRLIFGGWGVFGIGAGVTNLGITPIVGYRVTDNFSLGIGFGYQYLRVKDYFSVIVDPVTGREEFKPLNAHFYSPSLWARHIIWSNVFAHVEYEHNISTYKEYANNLLLNPPYEEKNVSVSVPSLLVGGGLRQPVGGRAALVIMALYDVLQDPRSPYYRTFALRFGINVGF